LKKKGQAAEADVALSGLEDIEVLKASYEDNTSQGKDWIFDSGMWSCMLLKRAVQLLSCKGKRDCQDGG